MTFESIAGKPETFVLPVPTPVELVFATNGGGKASRKPMALVYLIGQPVVGSLPTAVAIRSMIERGQTKPLEQSIFGIAFPMRVFSNPMEGFDER